MRPPTRLLLLVIVPLIVAIGAGSWVSQRRAGASTAVRVRLPATTQLVREPAAVRWTSTWALSNARPVQVGGLLDGSTWYALQPSILDRPGRVPVYDVTVCSAVNGRNLGMFARPVAALPVPGDDRLLYAPTDASEIAAFDIDTRQPVWRTDLKLPVRKIAVHGARVLATTSTGVAALDAVTGRILWSSAAGRPTTDPALDATVACYGAGDTLYVIDAASGSPLRQVAVPDIWGPLLLDGGSAYVCGWTAPDTPTLAMGAIDLSSGFVRWQWRSDTIADRPFAPRRLFRPVLADGALYLTFANTLCAIDAATGRERWRWAWRVPTGTSGRPASPAPPTWRDLGPPSVIGGIVYAPSVDDLTGLDPATGREVWRFEADAGERNSLLAAPTFGAAGLLFTSVGSPQLRAIKDDLHPVRAAAAVTPSAKALDLAWATGVASTAALLLIILAVFGWWRAAIALVCLCLCSLTVWGWWRSYAGVDFVGFSDLKRRVPFEAQATRGVTSSRGRLVFGTKHEIWNTAGGRRATGTGKDRWIWARAPHEEPAATTDRGGAAGLLDFRWTRRQRPSGTALGNQSETTLTLPHWIVALALGVAPLAWLTGVWRDRGRRRPRGHCENCGYDLRGITGRCPECGWDLPPDQPKPKRRGLPSTR